MEVSTEELVADFWGFRADAAELAAAELVAGGIIEGPIVGLGEGFGDVEPEAKVEQPFIELVASSVGEAPSKAVGLFEEDLGRIDDNAFDRGVEDDLAGEGVEGHLVVWFVLVEVAIAESSAGGFLVHDEELVVEGDDAIEVAAEEVGLGIVDNLSIRAKFIDILTSSILWPPIKLESEGEFYRWDSVGFDVGLTWIVTEVVEVIHEEGNQG